jgi:hypothetical protein
MKNLYKKIGLTIATVALIGPLAIQRAEVSLT